jgi:hypothetical protein
MLFEWIQNDITSIAVVERLQITPVRVGDHSPISPLQRVPQQLADGGRFPRPRSSDELEVFGFIQRCDSYAS